MCQQDSEEPSEIQQLPQGYKIYHYDRVSSTNDLAKKIARKGTEDRIVILAETQAYGKGRLGRRWLSPMGGVWLSIILRPQFSPKEALKLTFVMSSAVAKTIKAMYGLETEVKWSNDVLVEGRKVCGILTETSTREDIVDFVVVGVGINANVDLESFPSNLRNSVTSLKHELGRKIERKALTKSLLQNFESRYRRLQQGLWSVLLREWKSLAAFLGSHVEVAGFDEVLYGKAVDVVEDGALIIRLDDGTLKKIVAGDVTLRRTL